MDVSGSAYLWLPWDISPTVHSALLQPRRITPKSPSPRGLNGLPRCGSFSSSSRRTSDPAETADFPPLGWGLVALRAPKRVFDHVAQKSRASFREVEKELAEEIGGDCFTLPPRRLFNSAW